VEGLFRCSKAYQEKLDAFLDQYAGEEERHACEYHTDDGDR